MNRVYRKKNYNLYDMGDEYIIHNINKNFQNGHTHIRNYRTAIFLIDLAIHKSIPHHLHPYFLESLSRITDDPTYKRKLEELLYQKKIKTKQFYYNPQKGIKNKKYSR